MHYGAGKITENQTFGEELVEIMPKQSLHLIERYRNNSIFDQKISLSTKISRKFLFADSQNLNSGASNLLGFKGRFFQFESTVREKFKIFGRIFIPVYIVGTKVTNYLVAEKAFQDKFLAKFSDRNESKVFLSQNLGQRTSHGDLSRI